MRIILKPAGIAIVASIVVLLSGAVLMQTISNKTTVVMATPETTNAASSATEDRTVVVNLNTVGKTDWTLWKRAEEVVRKANVNQGSQIGPLIVRGKAQTYTARLRSFTWQDGTPEASGTNYQQGLKVSADGDGFIFSVPASIEKTQTLRTYIGAYRGGGIFTAKVVDNADINRLARARPTDVSGREPERIDTASVASSSGQTARLYTIRYKADKPNQSLLVSWVKAGGAVNEGYITIQGAALE